jgi:hypothetical protein
VLDKATLMDGMVYIDFDCIYRIDFYKVPVDLMIQATFKNCVYPAAVPGFLPLMRCVFVVRGCHSGSQHWVASKLGVVRYLINEMSANSALENRRSGANFECLLATLKALGAVKFCKRWNQILLYGQSMAIILIGLLES